MSLQNNNSSINAYCIVGFPGAGKTTAASVFEENGVPVLEMGEVVREYAIDAFENEEKEILKYCESGELTSHAIGKWITEKRDKLGSHIVAQWTVNRAQSISSDVIVIEGLRSPEELEVYNSMFDNVIIIEIQCTREKRLKNLKSRGREDERNFTRDDIIERDKREIEWGLQDVLQKSDVAFENSGSEEELINKINDYVSKNLN